MTLLTDQGQAASLARPFSDLGRLIHPTDIETFRRDYWEKRHLLVRQADPGCFTDLLSLDDVDRVLSLSTMASDNLRVVVDGAETPMSDLATSGGGANGTTNALEELYRRYRTGSTIVLSALNQRWKPLQTLCRTLGAETSARFQANVYLTPPDSQGFKAHYDMHDVFVAQVHGVKRWRLHGAPYALPMRSQPYDKSRPEPDVTDEFDLRPGDLLYLPRGTIHSARANDTASLHITFGVHPILWSQILRDTLEKVFIDDARFRTGLPLGFGSDDAMRDQVAEEFADLVRELADQLSAARMTADSYTRAASINLPVLRGHLTDLERLDTIDSSTTVRRRPALRWHLRSAENTVTLEFHNKAVHFPVRVTEELRYLTGDDGPGFRPADLPGNLDEPGRVFLVRSLVEEGFLTLAC